MSHPRWRAIAGAVLLAAVLAVGPVAAAPRSTSVTTGPAAAPQQTLPACTSVPTRPSGTQTVDWAPVVWARALTSRNCRYEGAIITSPRGTGIYAQEAFLTPSAELVSSVTNLDANTDVSVPANLSIVGKTTIPGYLYSPTWFDSPGYVVPEDFSPWANSWPDHIDTIDGIYYRYLNPDGTTWGQWFSSFSPISVVKSVPFAGCQEDVPGVANTKRNTATCPFTISINQNAIPGYVDPRGVNMTRDAQVVISQGWTWATVGTTPHGAKDWMTSDRQTAAAVIYIKGKGTTRPPVASFSVSAGGTPGQYTFTSTSTDPDNDIVSTAWDFGDGATATGTSAQHTYTHPGPFTATLKVTDGGGRFDTTTRVVDGSLKISQVTTSPATLIAGDNANLTVTVRNESSFPATGVTTALGDVAPPGGLELVAGPTPASAPIAPGGTAAFSYTVNAPDAGTVSVNASATGTAGGSTVTAPAVTRTLTVEGAKLTGTLATTPEHLRSGKPGKAILTLTNNGSGAVEDVEPGPLTLDPSAGTHVGTPTPTSLASLAPGASADFSYDITIDDPGAYHASVAATATDPDSGQPVHATVKADLTVVSGPIVVTTTGDEQEPEADRGDQACDVDPATAGEQCTLRAAIEESNALQQGGDGPQSIAFAIPGADAPVISVAEPLPEIEGTVDLDGTTQPGGDAARPRVSTPTGLDAEGLVLTGGGSTIRGLDVENFRVGIVLRGTGGHHVLGNTVRNHQDVGIQVESSGNVVGAGVATAACTDDCNRLDSNGQAGPIHPDNPRNGSIVVLGGSGNHVGGNLIGTVDREGLNLMSEGIVVRGGTETTVGPGNVISGRVGVLAVAPVTIKGNQIGVNPDGTVITSVSETSNGVPTQGWIGVWARGSGIVVGGPGPGDRNVISGHGQPRGADWMRPENGARASGVLLDGPGVMVQGNLIGTNTNGTAARPNYHGIRTAEGSLGAEIRDNVMSGNTHLGVLNREDPVAVIAGNKIGTNLAGTAAIPNERGVTSVSIVGGPRADRSTTCTSPCNLISGNAFEGVSATGVAGNFIGTNLAGSGPVPNRTGVVASPETERGAIGGSSNAAVDGTCDQSCNLIAFNRNGGIGLGSEYSGGPGTADILGNVVRDNEGPGIGVRSTGPTTIGDEGSGHGNLISGNGGPGVLAGEANGVSDVKLVRNTIRVNRGAGVLVADNAATFGVESRANAIVDNGGLGIDLSLTGLGIGQAGDGPTPNVRNVDGPNHLTPFPRLTAATVIDGNLRVAGRMEFFRGSATVLRIDVYASRTCDPTGYGEGERYLGTTMTAALTNGRINATVLGPPAGFGVITATATAVDGSTSEFTPCKALQLGTTLHQQADVGETELEVASSDGFQVGDEVVVGPETDNEEPVTVTGYGSLIVDPKLKFPHAAGELVVRTKAVLVEPPTTTTTTPTGETTTTTPTGPTTSTTPTTQPGGPTTVAPGIPTTQAGGPTTVTPGVPTSEAVAPTTDTGDVGATTADTPGSGSGTTSSGSLPRTGSDQRPLVTAGLILIASGVLLRSLRRRTAAAPGAR